MYQQFISVQQLGLEFQIMSGSIRQQRAFFMVITLHLLQVLSYVFIIPID